MTNEYISEICTLIFYGTLSFGAAVIVILIILAMIGFFDK